MQPVPDDVATPEDIADEIFMPKASKAKVAVNARYDDKAYDKYLVRIPKGQKATVQAAAEQEGDIFYQRLHQ